MSTTPHFSFLGRLPFCVAEAEGPAPGDSIGDFGFLSLEDAMAAFWKLKSLEMQVSYTLTGPGPVVYSKDFSYVFQTNRIPRSRVCKIDPEEDSFYTIFEKTSSDGADIGLLFPFDDTVDGNIDGFYLQDDGSYAVRAKFQNEIPLGFFAVADDHIFISVTDYGSTTGNYDQLDSQTFDLSLPGGSITLYFYADADFGPWTLNSWAFDLVPENYTFV